MTENIIKPSSSIKLQKNLLKSLKIDFGCFEIKIKKKTTLLLISRVLF